MITESEMEEKLHSCTTVIKAVAYPWGVEFEKCDPAKES